MKSDSKVVRLTAGTNDARDMSPEHLLRRALSDVELGERKEERVLILFLQDDEVEYSIRYYMGGMGLPEAANLCAFAQRIFQSRMGY